MICHGDLLTPPSWGSYGFTTYHYVCLLFLATVLEKLRLGVWQGDIHVLLTDLMLRANALDGLELPLTLLSSRYH